MARPRLLACWDYSRPGYLRQIEGCFDVFDTSLLHFVESRDESKSINAHTFYWSEFDSAHEVLERLKPDAVLFMGLSGARAVAVNSACQRRGIPTGVAQHGFNHSQDYSRFRGRPMSLGLVAESTTSAVSFFLRSCWSRPLLVMGVVLRLLGRRLRVATRWRLHTAEIPTVAIALSEESGRAYRDHFAERVRIRITGLTEVYELLETPSSHRERDSVLLIDTPNDGNPHEEAVLEAEQKLDWVRSLAAAAAAHGLVLRWMLHPVAHDRHVPPVENLVVLRGAELAVEFDRAAVCVGFDSTLMVASVLARPTVLGEVHPSQVIDGARSRGLAHVVPVPGALSPEDLRIAQDLYESASHGVRREFQAQFDQPAPRSHPSRAFASALLEMLD